MADERPAELEDLTPVITPEELGKRWGVTVDLLRQWRVLGNGPRYLRLGTGRGRSTVRYRVEDVLAFEGIRLRQSTRDA